MSVDVTADGILLKRIAENDEDAFCMIFERYKHRFYGAALKMTRSPELAEEIVQEVFLTLWLHRASLAAVKNPESYLFTIVYNAISQQFRKIAREKTARQKASAEWTVSECSTEQIMVEKEHRHLLQNIIRELPTQQQLIYKLSKQEGLNREQIATQLRISPNTVKNHLLKAMKYIRANLPKEAFVLFCWLFIWERLRHFL